MGQNDRKNEAKSANHHRNEIATLSARLILGEADLSIRDRMDHDRRRRFFVRRLFGPGVHSRRVEVAERSSTSEKMTREAKLS